MVLQWEPISSSDAGDSDDNNRYDRNSLVVETVGERQSKGPVIPYQRTEIKQEIS